MTPKKTLYFILSLYFTCLVFSSCKKATQTAAPVAPNSYIKFTFDGVNYNFSASASTSAYVATTANLSGSNTYQTVLVGVSGNTSANVLALYLDYSGSAIKPGTVFTANADTSTSFALTNLTLKGSKYTSALLSKSVDVTVTGYSASGITGTFSGQVVTDTVTNTYHTFTNGQFNIKIGGN